MSDEGVFITEDPYQVDLFNKVSYDQIYDEHVFIFSLTSMINICKKYDLTIFDVAHIPTAGGSLRYYITKNKNIEKTSNIEKYLQIENKINLKSDKSYINFYHNCENSKKKLIDLINKYSKNQIVASYGATSKSTTIFNYCKIGPSQISFITDTTPTKQNKLSPGMHIPIYNYDYFCKNLPEYCFLGAWNHKREIFEKEENNFNLKGNWISHLDYKPLTL